MSFSVRSLAATGIAAVAIARLINRSSRFSFHQKTVVIAGGSRGLGLVMARCLCASGARVVLLARDAEELEWASRDLESRDGNVRTYVCDLTDESRVKATFASIISDCGAIDALINNAGVIVSAPFENQKDEDFEQSLAIHLYAPIYTIRAILPHFRRQGGGRILNISSIGGLIGVPHMSSYSAGKFALAGFSQAITAELRRENIAVTTAFPGLMRTGSHLHAQFRGQHAREFTWFSTASALPILSRNAYSCARHILEAFRVGRSRITFPWQWRAASLGNELMPDFADWTNHLFNALLPDPVDVPSQAFSGAVLRPHSRAPDWLLQPAEDAARSHNEV